MTEGSTFGMPLRSGRPPQSPSSSTFRAMAPALSTSRRRPRRRRGRTTPRRPASRPRTQVAVRVRLGHVLVDLAVREARQARVGGRDERLGFGRAGGRGHRDGALGDRQPVLVVWSVIVVVPLERRRGSLEHADLHVAEPCPRDRVADVADLAGLALPAVRRAEHTHSRYRSRLPSRGRWRRWCGRSRRVRSGTGRVVMQS